MTIALKDLDFISPTCDCNGLECPDAIICSDSTSPQLEIAVHAGYVVDAIEVNGRGFGSQYGGNRQDVTIQPAEKVRQIKYGIHRNSVGADYNNGICGLHFITEAVIYGPYADPCETEYTVSISEDLTLPEFLKQEMTYIGAKNFVSGFSSQVALTESKI